MATFPIRDDEYFVEEISYEEMMSVLAIQEHKNPNLEPERRSTSKLYPQLTANEIDANRAPEQASMSQRIKENADRQLPDWLLNN